MNRLLLVDGHYFLYRSYFAIRGLTNSRGEATNAIFGFTKALRRMLMDLKPDRAAVVWDAGLPERRTALQPDYKQNRPPMPDDMRAQEEFLHDVMVPALGIECLSLPATEADDLIASYALAFPGETVIATNDKDILQLVSDRIRIYSTNKTDVTDKKVGFALLGLEEIEKKWGVEPRRIHDILALTGDTSDNIPGVEGIGQKTAGALINQFGSVEALLERTDEISSVRQREKVVAAADRIRQNREMVRLDLDLELPVAAEDLRIDPKWEKLVEAVRGCEFKSLLAEVEREKAALAVGATDQGELF
ncbi:MAG: 5'-3' exonuclease H3TH domain-containing protein [Chthoniobacterales bacterium]